MPTKEKRAAFLMWAGCLNDKKMEGIPKNIKTDKRAFGFIVKEKIAAIIG